MTEPLRFGVHTGPQNCTFDELRQIWSRADESGFWWASVWDHFYPAQSQPDGDCFEAVASHAALAALTKNLRVGCLVYCAGYRNPAVLAKVACTLDHISGGRAEMGIGAGWHDEEFGAYHIPFLSAGQRLKQMDEAATIIKSLWTKDRTTFQGEHFGVTDARCNPKMVQERPRLWLGAMGEKAMSIVARHADGWNAAFLTPEAWGERNSLLSRRLEELGRDPASVIRSVNVGLVLGADEAAATAKRERFGEQFGSAAPFVLKASLAGTPQQVIDRIGEYREAGADLVVLALRPPFDLDGLETFIADVMPTFA
jgi:alkanesulfonate monooxygenase SsuD/methylene tetrahydromethanopterin reductase-like flavin-dependent oxidoreductase (luciferase family)